MKDSCVAVVVGGQKLSGELPVMYSIEANIDQEVLESIKNGSFYGIKTEGALVIGVKLKSGKEAVITIK